MERVRQTAELGKFKETIGDALLSSSDIKKILLGDTTGMSGEEIMTRFKSRVKDHLFAEETITEEATYIFYEVTINEIMDNLKNCKIFVYVVSHRQIISDYYDEKYHGNLVDVLAQMVESVLLNDKNIINQFGIGELNLNDVDIYNGKRFYGRELVFSVPAFRNVY